MKNFYIQRIEKKSKAVQYFTGFIPLGVFGIAEHWIESPKMLSYEEADEAFFRITSDKDNLRKYAYKICIN